MEIAFRHTITCILMPQPSLQDLLEPATTALVTQECQGGVIGPEAGLPLLAEEARREAIPNIAKLLDAARAAGVAVVHCLVERRGDGRGSNTNARLFAAGKSFPVDLTPGSAGASVLPELGPLDTDLVLTRTHGVGPMCGTDLDSVLRNLGIKTIVGVGVSVNVAIHELRHGRGQSRLSVRVAARRGEWISRGNTPSPSSTTPCPCWPR